jgi:RNA polymerase sigma factor (sigma-70 family)
VENKKTIAAFLDKDEKVIESIYQEFKPKFQNWLKGRYKITAKADLSEIYQRSFTILYFNIKKGKVDHITSSIETYLFGIGKMVIKEWWREKSKMKQIEEDTTQNLEAIDLFYGAFSGNEGNGTLNEKLHLALKNLGEPCKSIITLFYWDRNSMEAIASKMGYKNELGAKKKKYLCLKKLTELMQKT